MNDKVVVITQPNYAPWLGYFELVERADTFVFLDDVQYIKREWINRNRLKGVDDKPFWITVPVEGGGGRQNIDCVKASGYMNNDRGWSERHLSSIRRLFSKTEFYDVVYPVIEKWLSADYEYIADLNIEGIARFSELMGVEAEFIRSSEMSTSGKRTEKLFRICDDCGASVYYTSVGAAQYLEDERAIFDNHSIEIEYQNWIHPKYKQYGSHFVSHLSIIDSLMNIGPKETKKLIL
jgi:hypothetical protein